MFKNRVNKKAGYLTILAGGALPVGRADTSVAVDEVDAGSAVLAGGGRALVHICKSDRTVVHTASETYSLG